ncbi:Sucrase/ferredoxin-like-domain-containing protein [Pyronema domesticum]|uniref:Similar to Actin patches distal protein 1 acc. no. P38281 n=1 Tax=Pyronema omphalodes (strain CBS 100304) TaxID=1076935 RepID=U4LVU1_PYROM|nr:Sucrase/ferredoxin-like-domain-containing protein [Pyronema domesticum]CCX34872.1 Similar to Actin patches distal protein 1; acc. no. P38281 [Pyronema omphalodes CBS 100304]
MSFAALKRLGSNILSPLTTPRSGTPVNSVTPETLFPVVDKDEDGENCNHDCEACPVVGGSGYGKAFDKIGVETKDKLWGGIKGYATHVIVATGETDWIRDVEEIKGSVMEALWKGVEKVERGRMMISASNIPPPHEYYEKDEQKPTKLLLLPAFEVLEGIRPADAETVIKEFVNTGPTTSDPLDRDADPSETEESAEDKPEGEAPSADSATATDISKVTEKLSDLTVASPVAAPQRTLKSSPYPHDFLILICSHRHRDARCGISAPILKKEFEKQLRPLGLWRDLTDSREGGASVVFINHVGGHKYAANVIIYRKEDGQGIWLARVSPKHVEGIVKHTIVKGKIVHPEMIRGGFNRKTGLASW